MTGAAVTDIGAPYNDWVVIPASSAAVGLVERVYGIWPRRVADLFSLLALNHQQNGAGVYWTLDEHRRICPGASPDVAIWIQALCRTAIPKFPLGPFGLDAPIECRRGCASHIRLHRRLHFEHCQYNVPWRTDWLELRDGRYGQRLLLLLWRIVRAFTGLPVAPGSWQVDQGVLTVPLPTLMSWAEIRGGADTSSRHVKEATKTLRGMAKVLREGTGTRFRNTGGSSQTDWHDKNIEVRIPDDLLEIVWNPKTIVAPLSKTPLVGSDLMTWRAEHGFASAAAVARALGGGEAMERKFQRIEAENRFLPTDMRQDLARIPKEQDK